jgi:hypothetical protein
MKRLPLIPLLFIACKKNDSAYSSATGTDYFKFQTVSANIDFEQTNEQVQNDFINSGPIGSEILIGAGSSNLYTIAAINTSSNSGPFEGGVSFSYTPPTTGTTNFIDLSLTVQVGNDVFTYSCLDDTSIVVNITGYQAPSAVLNPSTLVSGLIQGTFSGNVHLQIARNQSVLDGGAYENDYDYTYESAPIVKITGSFSVGQ